MYRPEHPNPQFERESWLNLNGSWRFAFDFGRSGIDRKMYLADEKTEALFDKEITVPFCPESDLSKIGYKDFINAVWYRRTVCLNSAQVSGRTLLHFGAVDYEAHVYVNGAHVASHLGGYNSFTADISDNVREGGNVITVYAADDTRSGRQAAGKQSTSYHSNGCLYTRTTGIWQTVWLEFVPEDYVKSVKFYPDINKKCFGIDCDVSGKGEIKFSAVYDGKTVGSVSGIACGSGNRFTLPLSEMHLWEAGCGRLYDIIIEYKNDKIKSYAGMREVKIDGYKFMLNGKPLFQRTVLDQGFYPDGIYTAPSDDALLNDIKISKAFGFNGARLHQKIFEPRFLYHCDKEGYIVWGEHGNWGLDVTVPEAFLSYMPEWLEAIERDFNHPSIIGWCPFNETWALDNKRQIGRTLENIYKMTKALDPTRPCIDTSGFYHVVTDIYDLHDYTQDPDEFTNHFKGFPEDTDTMETCRDRQHYIKGLPLFVSEYGGIKWDTAGAENAWGYGNAPKTEEEFIERYRGLTLSLLNHPYIMGFCYTQLYDIEQETNGLCDYHRNPKFDIKTIYDITSAPAAIEKDQ